MAMGESLTSISSVSPCFSLLRCLLVFPQPQNVHFFLYLRYIQRWQWDNVWEGQHGIWNWSLFSPLTLKMGVVHLVRKSQVWIFYFKFVSLLQSFGFHIRNRSVSVFWHAGAHEDA